MTALYPRLTGLRPRYDRGWPRYIALRNGPILPPLPSGVQGAQPPPGLQRVPLLLKTSEGGAGGIAAHAKPNPPLMEGAGHNKTL